MRFLALAPALSILALAGCTTVPRVAPPPAPAAPVAVPPPPAPVAAPRGSDWRDWPVTPGNWVYRQDGRGSIALYGAGGADAELTLRCDRDRGRVFLSRKGAGVSQLSVRTSSSLHPLRVVPTSGAVPYLAAELQPRDAALDAMGYSRGRFVVEGAGLPTLVLPAWPEILRVAEDCRG